MLQKTNSKILFLAGPATGWCPVQPENEICLMGDRDVLSGKLPPPGQALLAWQLHVNLELDFGRKLILFGDSRCCL